MCQWSTGTNLFSDSDLVLLILFLFFVFQVTAKFAIMFITVQYNVTQVLGELTTKVNVIYFIF